MFPFVPCKWGNFHPRKKTTLILLLSNTITQTSFGKTYIITHIIAPETYTFYNPIIFIIRVIYVIKLQKIQSKIYINLIK